MHREQIQKRREILEKIYLEDTLKILRFFEEGWSFCTAAKKAGMNYDYAMALRRRNPEFNAHVLERSYQNRMRKKQP